MSFAPPPEFPSDHNNPYAPPMAELRQEPEFLGPATGARVPATVDGVLAAAWQIYKARMGICVAIVLGVVGLNWVFSFLTNMIVGALSSALQPPAVVGGAQISLTLMGVVVQLWLTLGQTAAMLKISRGHDVEFAEIFRGGRYLLSTLGALFLFVLIVIGVVALCMIPGGIVAYATKGQGPAMPITLALGGLLAFLAVIVLTLRLTQFIYLIVDRDAGAIEALGLSNQIATGREGQIFLVNLVSGVINLGGLLACLVGAIFTMPLTFLMAAILYLALTGQPTAAYAGGEVDFPGVKPLSDADFDAYP